MERKTNEQLGQMLEARDGRQVVLFTSPTCGTCQLAKRMLAPIEKLYAGASFLEVDINTAPGRARQLEIQSVPCLLVFDSGEERGRLYKMQSGSYLLEQLHPYLKKDLTEKRRIPMQAPEFQLKEMSSGVEWSLEQLKGKPVLLTFWASWCPDSSADLVQKNRFYEQMNEDSPLQFVTINVTGRERREEDPKMYVENNNYRFPVLQDEGVDTYRRYKCEGVPSTFIIDEQGDIVAQYGDKASFIDIMQSLQKVNSI